MSENSCEKLARVSIFSFFIFIRCLRIYDMGNVNDKLQPRCFVDGLVDTIFILRYRSNYRSERLSSLPLSLDIISHIFRQLALM